MKNYWIVSVLGALIFTYNTFGFNLTATDVGGGRLQIGYQLQAGENAPSGIALQIGLDQGAYVSASTDLACSPYFPVFVDYAYAAGQNYEYGQGHPAANLLGPGTPNFPVSNFSISVGAPLSLQEGEGLIGDINGDMVVNQVDMAIMTEQWLEVSEESYFFVGDLNMDYRVDLRDYAFLSLPAWEGSVGNLLTIQLYNGGAGITNVTIQADTLRGGIVDQSGISIGGNLPITTTVVVPEPTTLLLLGLSGLSLLKRRK